MTQKANNRRESLNLIAFMVGAAAFFVAILFICFFVVIVAINNYDISGENAPNILMIGLVPPSIGTFLLFTKVFGRFM